MATNKTTTQKTSSTKATVPKASVPATSTTQAKTTTTQKPAFSIAGNAERLRLESVGLTPEKVAQNNQELRTAVANAKAGTGPNVGLVGAPKDATWQDVQGQGYKTVGQRQVEGAGAGITKEKATIPETGMNDWTAAQMMENASLNVANAAESVNKTMQSGLGELQKQLTLAGEANKAAFDELVKGLGSGASAFQEQLQNIQKSTGKSVDLTNGSLQRELQIAQEKGNNDFAPILEKYLGGDLPKVNERMPESTQQLDSLITQAQKLGVDQSIIDSAKQGRNLDAGVFPRVIQQLQNAITQSEQQLAGSGVKEDQLPGTVKPTPEESFTQQLDAIATATPASLMQQLSNMDLENMSPSQVLGTMLKMNLQSIGSSSDSVTGYLDKMEKNFEASYKDAIADGNLAKKETNAIISGRNVTPTTWQSLQAKVAKEAADFGIESIEMQEDYLKERFDQEMDRERDKRGRLDGYLKAKLHSMGAQDSTAGLTMMALQTDAADLRLQQMNTDQNFQIAQLNLESRKIKANYVNQISQVTIQARAEETAAKTKLDEQLMQITGQRITNEQEKNKLMLGAFNNYATESNRIKESERNFKLQTEQFGLQKMQFAVEKEMKYAGVTGTIWTTNPVTGQLENTGVNTIATQQFNSEMSYKAATLSLQSKDSEWDRLEGAMGMFTDNNKAVPAELLSMASTFFGGLPASISQASTVGEFKDVMQYEKAQAYLKAESFNQEVGTEIDAKLLAVSGQPVKRGGLAIDPLSIGDIAETLKDTPHHLTQKYSPKGSKVGTDKGGGHPGIDLVFTNEYGNPVGASVPALRGGMVIAVNPDSGNATKTPFGNSVIIQDSQGIKWQYSHLAAIDFGVGDVIQKGESIGPQGRTGNWLSSKTGLAAGVHTDIRIVGHSKPEWYQELKDMKAPVASQAPQMSGGIFGSLGANTAASTNVSPGMAQQFSYGSDNLKGFLKGTAAERAAYSEQINQYIASGDVDQAFANMKSNINAQATGTNGLSMVDLDKTMAGFKSIGAEVKLYQETVYDKAYKRAKDAGKTKEQADKEASAIMSKALSTLDSPERALGASLGIIDKDLTRLHQSVNAGLKRYVKSISGSSATDAEVQFISRYFPSAFGWRNKDAEVTMANVQKFIEDTQKEKQIIAQNVIGANNSDVVLGVSADRVIQNQQGQWVAVFDRNLPDPETGSMTEAYTLTFD